MGINEFMEKQCYMEIGDIVIFVPEKWSSDVIRLNSINYRSAISNINPEDSYKERHLRCQYRKPYRKIYKKAEKYALKKAKERINALYSSDEERRIFRINSPINQTDPTMPFVRHSDWEEDQVRKQFWKKFPVERIHNPAPRGYGRIEQDIEVSREEAQLIAEYVEKWNHFYTPRIYKYPGMDDFVMPQHGNHYMVRFTLLK